MRGSSTIFLFGWMVGCSSPGSEPVPASSGVGPAKASVAASETVVAREPTPSLPSEAMVQRMLVQKVLEFPRVVMVLHTEVAANVPLKLFASKDLAQGADGLMAGGQPVRVVASEGEARFVLRGREDLGPAKVRVKFVIPPEGVAGHVDLVLADNVWSVDEAYLVER